MNIHTITQFEYCKLRSAEGKPKGQVIAIECITAEAALQANAHELRATNLEPLLLASRRLISVAPEAQYPRVRAEQQRHQRHR